MTNFTFFNTDQRDRLTNPRQGETKFGEALDFVTSFEALQNHRAPYVIFGIPEDVGIRGNYGKPGASSTWESFLAAFLNIQANQFNNPKNCLILGQLDCGDFMEAAQKVMATEKNPQEKLGAIAAQIDDEVSALVSRIVSAGKIPIVIGGGHNNAFGNIKGTSQGLRRPVNILNIDAHTDLRRTDYRHSGNGFSFAKKEGLMAQYAMFGIHRNYTPQYIFDQFQQDKTVDITFFEALLLKDRPAQQAQFEAAMDFVDRNFGLEIDCDAITDFSSSAKTPSGFSVNEIRRFILLAKRERVYYLHLTEAVAQGNPQIGKALSYMTADFMTEEG